MKWLNSLDELLFEVMSWLIFFPLTLWRSLTRPLGMMAYADAQLALPEEDQYADAVSPPLFLALALLLAHAVATALGQTDAIIANRHGLSAMVDDQTSALLLRLVVFAIFPLVMALRLLRRRGTPVARATLRLPFYAQCYPTATFALALTIGTSLALVAQRSVHVAGLAIIVLAFVYFLAVKTRWFAAQLGTGWFRAFGAAALGAIEGFILFLIVGFLFTR